MVNLFKRGDIARLVTNAEVARLTTDGLLYGAAAIVDKHFGIVQHLNPAQPPVDLLDGQQALIIKTTAPLSISFLSSTQNRRRSNDISAHIKPVMFAATENGKVKNKTHKCKLSVKLSLKQNDFNLCETVFRIMASKGAQRLSAKDFLKGVAHQYEDHVSDRILQRFAADDYEPGALIGHKEMRQTEDIAKQVLASEFDAIGLKWNAAIFSVDNRSLLLRYLWPSLTHDGTIVLATKFIIAPAATAIGTALRLLGIITWP